MPGIIINLIREEEGIDRRFHNEFIEPIYLFPFANNVTILTFVFNNKIIFIKSNPHFFDQVRRVDDA